MCSALPHYGRELARDVQTSLFISGASAEDIEKALAPKPHVDPTTKLSPYFHDFLPMFDPRNAKLLPPHRPDDHTNELMSGKDPSDSTSLPYVY